MVAGYTLPAGTLVTGSPWVTQRLPALFAHPYAFLPERFERGQGERYALNAYFPFGAGMRHCNGEPFATFEGKLMLTTLVQRCVPRLLPGAPALAQPRHARGLRLTMQPRVGAPT